MGNSLTARHQQLSETEIIEAALRLTERVGLRKLTMRGLAEELGVTPMAVYYYVPNKDALIQLVVNAILGRVELPQDKSQPWDERLWIYLRDIRSATLAYPGVAEHLLHTELTPAGKGLFKGSLDMLKEGGFDEESALLAFSAIYAYTYGRAAFQTMLTSQPKRKTSRKPHRVVPGLHELASEEHCEFGHRALMAGLQLLLTGDRRAP